MKKLTLLLFVAILLTACGPKPQDVVNSWQAALNKGDIDTALSHLAEDAVVTISPAADGDGVYNGHTEIQGWYETIVAGKGAGTLSNCKVTGDTITCLSTYADEGLKAMGVDSIEGEWVAILRDGKIQSYTFTITPESLAKFPPPPEPPSTPTAIEASISTAEAIIGRWEAKNDDYVVLHEFQPNGIVLVTVSGVGLISREAFVFEDGLLKFEDTSGDCAGMVGKYEVYGAYAGDQLTELRFVLVGEDPCSDRRSTLNGNTMLPWSSP